MEEQTETQENLNDLIFYTKGEEEFRISSPDIRRGNVCPETKLEVEKND